jgi:hypothetical protein
MNYLIHAREKVEQLFTEKELDRLVKQACAAAEQSETWQTGQEFIFEIEDAQYAHPGIELSWLIVCHKGTIYEIYYYDGPSSETFQ